MSTDQEQTNAGRPALRLADKGEKSARGEERADKPALPRQFVTFTFYKARPEWRHLGAAEKT